MPDLDDFRARGDQPGEIWKITGPNSLHTALQAEATTRSTSLIAVTYAIDNVYEDGTEIRTVVEALVPVPPPVDDEAYEDWENDHVFNYTGTAYPEGGDAGYFVEVTASSEPGLLETGRKFEFV